MLAIALAFVGVITLIFSVAAPWVLVLAFGESVDAPSVWFFQVLPAFGLICIALSIIVYLVGGRKKN